MISCKKKISYISNRTELITVIANVGVRAASRREASRREAFAMTLCN